MEQRSAKKPAARDSAKGHQRVRRVAILDISKIYRRASFDFHPRSNFRSGLLKTGLDHLVDQLLYAHAEKSIRPKVRAEIKRFLNLADASDQQSVACVPHYPMAAPPHYGRSFALLRVRLDFVH